MNKTLWGLWILGWTLVAGLFLSVLPVQAQEVFRCDPEALTGLSEQLRAEGVLTLQVPEEEFNRCLERYQSAIRRQTPFRSVDVDFRPGEVRLRGHLAWFSLTVSVEPYVDQGRVYVRLREVRLGVLPLPTFLLRPHVARLNAELERAFQRPPLSHIEVQRLDINDDGFVLTVAVRK